MPDSDADLFAPPPTGSVITGLVPSAKHPERVSVRVDGKAWASLPQRLVEELGLAAGQPFDAAVAERIASAAVFEKAYRKAVNRLNRRGMSRKQLDTKLRQLGFDEATRGRVLTRLEARGFIDDEAFARQLVHELQSRKPAGPALLRAKLAQKGVDREIVGRVLAEQAQSPTRDPIADAAELAQKKLRSLRGLDAMTQKRRLWGLLARRGFDPDTIKEAMGKLEAWGEER